ALCQADWPGNVRQLENTIARLAALGNGGVVGVEAFATDRNRPAGAPGKASARPPSLAELLAALEKYVIAETLASVSGNQSEAARRLGVSRGLLGDRLRRYGLLAKAT